MVVVAIHLLVGRVAMKEECKESYSVYDFFDDYITLKRMWEKLEKGYKALGYTFDEQTSFIF